MLGEINMYAFIVLVATGTFLALFFVPGHTNVVYEGPYAFLRGTRMSEAYDSALRICFEVNAGLLIRQIHHWAANIFVAGIVVHMGRIFFSGAFRNPRELNWIIGVLLLFAGMFEGFTGYSMPDDLLSGVGLRIAVSILQSVPFIGTWATFFLIGGVWPTGILIQRLFVTHVFIMPALIALGITVHLAIVWRQKHTQFPGPRHTEHNVVGSPLFPQYTVRSIALFMGVIAVCCLLGALGSDQSDLALGAVPNMARHLACTTRLVHWVARRRAAYWAAPRDSFSGPYDSLAVLAGNRAAVRHHGGARRVSLCRGAAAQ